MCELMRPGVSTVGWNVTDDREKYMAAERLHRVHGRLWWVMWAPGIRRFYAFYQGNADIEPFAEDTPQALDARIRRTLVAIARTDPASFWRCPRSGCSWTSLTSSLS